VAESGADLQIALSCDADDASGTGRLVPCALLYRSGLDHHCGCPQELEQSEVWLTSYNQRLRATQNRTDDRSTPSSRAAQATIAWGLAHGGILARPICARRAETCLPGAPLIIEGPWVTLSCTGAACPERTCIAIASTTFSINALASINRGVHVLPLVGGFTLSSAGLALGC
jgi:hypothetical protein